MSKLAEMRMTLNLLKEFDPKTSCIEPDSFQLNGKTFEFNEYRLIPSKTDRYAVDVICSGVDEYYGDSINKKDVKIGRFQLVSFISEADRVIQRVENMIFKFSDGDFYAADDALIRSANLSLVQEKQGVRDEETER